jgi:hypothetical protein
MNKEVCIIYLDQAIASLHKMRIAVSDLPPDAAVDFFSGCTKGSQYAW